MAFEDLVALCELHGGYDLRKQVIQVHKDYGKGLEKARRVVFPLCRCVQDYFHMRQNVGPALQKKLLRKFMLDVKRRSKAVGSAVKKKCSKSHRIEVKVHKKNIMEFIADTRTLPSVQLFDALWTVFLFRMENVWKETGASHYLLREYFHKPSLSNIQKIFKGVRACSWGKTDILLAFHWIGIFGTAPGIGTGSLTIEARHSHWEAEMEVKSKESVFHILPSMQDLYRRWKTTFAWGDEKMTLSNRPKGFVGSLLNGSTLARLGRSTAIDFWKKRSGGNFYKSFKCTGHLDSQQDKAYTYFYVMRTCRRDGVLPADTIINADTARGSIAWIVHQ